MIDWRDLTWDHIKGIALILVIGFTIYNLKRFFDVAGYVKPLVFIIYCFGFYLFIRYSKKIRRKQRLMSQYSDEEVVRYILEKTIWEGETAEQLEEALGSPEEVESQVYRGKRKEVWKYYPREDNQYDLKITLEDDSVRGWEKITN